MLILNESRPEISLYYLGALLIKLINEGDIHEIYLSELYILFNNTNPISFNRFMLVLDWLYIIGVIKTTVEGKILCTLKN
ncbi:ABC-three component system middle component 6 [Acinetobacter baumannii]|uniref:ABC-three component system middle component 6 n=1 Tax=Acinetobacter baumannii TaxID=470 RepID=UPI0004F572B9